ncbi:helix-turn-helix domain-containing protein [Streptomyces sp. WG7]|uniref:helix-turn-helix domain-containing protein n=1 Tax=Streptomyces sp. WG7 TaxID=3417650 RepID=UPI003CF0746D
MLAQVSSLPVPALPLEAIRHYAALQRDLEDFIAVAVRIALDRGADWPDISALTSVSPSSLKSRYSKAQVARVVQNRKQRRPAPVPSAAPGSVAFGESPILPEATEPSVLDRSRDALARALSHMHRHSGTSVRTTALQAGISPSYAYRIMSGERCPSWPTVQGFARACDTDPGNLFELWSAANGVPPDSLAQPHERALARFAGALRGMHLARARPPLTSITDKLGSVSANELRTIATVLANQASPEVITLSWKATAALTKAFQGDVTRIRRLWQAVQQTVPGPDSPVPTE